MKERIGIVRGRRWLAIVAVCASAALAAWLWGSAQFSGPTVAHAPSLTIERNCSPREVAVGEQVLYTYIVNNNTDLIPAGSAILQRESVTDTLLGDITDDFPEFLSPGDSVTVEETRVVLESDPDPLFNAVTATYGNLTFGSQEVAHASCVVRIVGFIVVEKRNADGSLWTTPAVDFQICPGPVSDCTRDITTVTVGNGNPNPSEPVPKMVGDYTVCEEVPEGFTVEPSECQTVTVTENETVTAIFTNVPPPPEVTGRMTGGGSVFKRDGARVTRGFEIHCDLSEPNNIQVNWRKGNKFHLTSLTSAVCTDDPDIHQEPPAADFDTFTGDGTGRLNGVPGATIQFVFVDAGEPGKNDTALIQIEDADGKPVIDVSGFIDVGNLQAHKD